MRQRAIWALLLAILAVATLRATFRPAPGDFHSQRTAARAYLASFGPNPEPGERLYDWMEFQRWSDRDGNTGQLGTYIPQPPASLLPYVAICRLPRATGKVLFALVSLALFVASTIKLGRVMGATGFEMLVALAAIGGAIDANLVNGQEMLLVASLLNVSLAALLSGRPGASGTALGAAIALKLFGLPWLLLLALRRRFRAVMTAYLALVLMTALVVAGLGWEMLTRYVVDVLPASLSGDFHNLYHPSSQSIETILRRLFLPHPDWNPTPPHPSPSLYGFLARAVPLGVMLLALGGAATTFAMDAVLAYSLLLVGSILAAPTVNRYHIVPLIPAVLVMLRRREGQPAHLAAVLAATALASWISQRPPLPLQEPRVVGLLALFALLVVEAAPARWIAPAALALACAGGLLFPVDRGQAPSSWHRKTQVPFEPLLARFPDRRGEGLELHYQDTDAGTVFSWDGYSYDRNSQGDRVFERLSDDGHSALFYVGPEGVGLPLTSLPDADCRRPRFLDDHEIRFDLEQGSVVSSFVIELGQASARAAPAERPGHLLSFSGDTSVDGKRTAFVARVGRFTEIRERDGSGNTRTLVPPLGTSLDPRYSWDGKRLYFASDVGRCAGCTVIYGIDLP